MRLDSRASQLSGARTFLTPPCERLEQYRRSSTSSHFWLEALLAFSLSGSVYRGSHGYKGAAHWASLTDIVASASDSSEMYFQSIVDLSRAAERAGQGSTNNPETSGTPSCMPLVPGNN